MGIAGTPRELAGASGEVQEQGFVVRSSAQIHGILAALRDARELVVVHFGRRGEFVVTVVLVVDAARDELLLDAAPDPEVNVRLLQSGPLLVLAHAGGVRVQFRVDGAEAAQHEGLPALRLPFPQSLGRFERRASFRVRIPRGRMAECLSPDEAAGASARVIDLSCEGAALAPVDGLPLEPGAATPPWRLVLDGEPALDVALEIRRVAEARSFSGIPQKIVGARFVGLPAAAEMRIGRYLHRLQREARRAAALADLAARLRSEDS